MRVTVLDAAYTIHADDDGKIDCARCAITDTEANDGGSDHAAPALALEPADFTALFSADSGIFDDYEEALTRKDAELARLEAELE